MKSLALGLALDGLVFLNALLLLQVLAPGREGLRVVGGFVLKLCRERWVLAIFIAYWAVMGLNIALNRCDPWFTATGGRDFTPAIRRLEDGALIALQAAGSPALDIGASYVYFLLFPLSTMLPLFWFVHRGERRRATRLFLAFGANYAAALPFYLFFPVREAWAFDPRIRLLSDRVTPVLMEALRPMSGIDNCFPSLHTSIAVTCALFTLEYAKPKRLAVLGAGICLGTIFSLLYLGIHWMADAAAGAALGLAAYWATLGPLPAALMPRAPVPDRATIPRREDPDRPHSRQPQPAG